MRFIGEDEKILSETLEENLGTWKDFSIPENHQIVGVYSTDILPPSTL
jgi:hypothetical protein